MLDITITRNPAYQRRQPSRISFQKPQNTSKKLYTEFPIKYLHTSSMDHSIQTSHPMIVLQQSLDATRRNVSAADTGAGAEDAGIGEERSSDRSKIDGGMGNTGMVGKKVQRSVGICGLPC